MPERAFWNMTGPKFKASLLSREFRGNLCPGVCEQHLTYHLLMKCFWIAGGALSGNSCTLKFLTYMYINPKWTWTCSDYPCSTSFCCSVTKLCPTRYNPVGYSMPGSPVLHYLPELAHTHVHWVGDVIQPSHPLSLPSPFAFHPSHHHGLFQWVDSLHQVPKYLELQL